MRYLFIASFALACNDKGDDSDISALEDLNNDDGEYGDTADYPDEMVPGEGTMSTMCFWQSSAEGFDFDGDGDGERCASRYAVTTAVDVLGGFIRTAWVGGQFDSIIPDETQAVRLWALQRPIGKDDFGASVRAYPYDQVYSTDAYATAVGTAPSGWWSAFYWAETGDLDAFNTEQPYGDFYTVGAEIDDPNATDLTSHYCDRYDDTDDVNDHSDMGVCLGVEFYSGLPDDPPGTDAKCTAGTGRFNLVPAFYQDGDLDGNYGVMWKPLMDTGRGMMTADAIVKSIKIIDDHDVPIVVIHDGEKFYFDTDDTLVVGVRATTIVSDVRRVTKFGGAPVTGSSSFASETFPGTDALDLQADMTWSCPLAARVGTSSTPAPDPNKLAQGYTFAAKDIGCGAMKQKITIRPVPSAGYPIYVQVEQYGNPALHLTVPMHNNDGLSWFDKSYRGVTIKGYMEDHTPTEGADVTITELTFLGKDICTTGDFVFPKER